MIPVSSTQGYVPAKNHVYAKTYGRATALATQAEGVMREGGNASTMTELVDARPQVRVQGLKGFKV